MAPRSELRRRPYLAARINPAYSYLCSNDPRAHFGIGPADRVQSIDVIWPDGSEESFPGPNVDSAVELYKGKGQTKQ